jgi:uncharacterized protein
MEARVYTSMSSIPRSAWERLASRVPTPILDWNWLELLESSGSISEANGWTPCHLTLWEGNELVSGAPLYLRTHSWGDFVYDFSFAQVARQLRFGWYPKLVGMSPVTPSVGWHVLVADGYDERTWTSLWIAEAERLAQRMKVISLQFNFTEPAWFDVWKDNAQPPDRWHAWIHQNYLFENSGLADFDSYLALFDKNQRRNIIRERARFGNQDLHHEMVSGADIPDSWFPLMAGLYEKTNDRFGDYAARFLNPDFFRNLEKIRELLVFSAAIEKGRKEPLALAFLLRKNSVLLGRYWGEQEWRDCQYFNVCYYGPIDWAIRQGIKTFDPGAGTFLKARRGFASKTNLSLHRFFDMRAEKLFTSFLSELNAGEQNEIDELNKAVPFKSGWKPQN